MTTRHGPRTLGRFTTAELEVLTEHLTMALLSLPDRDATTIRAR